MPSPTSTKEIKAMDRLYRGFETNGLSTSLPLIKRIINHYQGKGVKFEAGGDPATPSLSIRINKTDQITLFRIASKDKGFIEVDFKGLSNQFASRQDDKQIDELQNNIRKIDATFRSKGKAKMEPWFQIHYLNAEEKEVVFLSAFDAILAHLLADDAQIHRPTKVANLARAWDILTKRASNNSLEEAQITYEDFRNEVLGRGVEERVKGSGGSHYLYPIQELCQDNHLPPLTGLVVGVNSKLPSSGYAGSGVLPYEIEMQSVLNYNWINEDNPWQDPGGGEFDQKKIVNELLQHDVKMQRWVEIPKRQYQSVFRKALLKVYGGKCAVCGIATEAVLDAAHIKPYVLSKASEEAHVTNGILLCKNHHASFDAHLWWIDEGYKIQKVATFATTKLGLHTTHFTLPKQKHHHPGCSFIQYHNKQINH